MDFKKAIETSLANAQQALDEFVADPGNGATIGRMADMLTECFTRGNKVLSCGNGGSACDALHFAEEFTGRFRGDRKALPVIPLLDGANLTCIANDYGFENIFSRGVEAYGKEGDILLAISTSGNSPNVIKAIDAAHKGGMKVLLFTGKNGGKLAGTCAEEILVRCPDTERVQEVHMVVLHILIESVERRMFPENYKD